MAIPLSGPTTVAESLTLSLVASSDAPLLLLDGDLRVIAASNSFGRAFQIDIAGTSGHLIFDLGAGEWNSPKLKSLLSAIASGQVMIEVYEMDLIAPDRAPRRLVIKVKKLAYGDPGETRLLVTVSDVTDARLAEKITDDLVRDKATLIQEIQQRVANSLQVIASVLLQSARNMQSEEMRTHLNDAHKRVMSIATVQRQLAASSVGEVELAAYFTQLCQNLGASMILDHNRLSIEVRADNNRVESEVSVSLGLIVTELVINALKHAFIEGGVGRIFVDYKAHGPNWTLSVGDDGIGMPSTQANPVAGLGASIIEALSRRLNATVCVADRKPGTTVSIVYIQIAAVDDAGSLQRAV